MNLSLLSRHFCQLSRYIYHAVAWCQVLFHAVCAVACYLMLWHVVCYSELSCGSCFVICCAAMSCSHLFAHVAACLPVLLWHGLVCHLLLLCAVRGYQVPSYVAAGINIWECIFLIVIFKSHWKDSGGESIRSQWYLVPRGWWKKFVRPGWSSCEILWLFPVPYRMALHLLLRPYYIHSCIFTSQISLPSQVSCCQQQLAQMLQGMNDPTKDICKIATS